MKPSTSVSQPVVNLLRLRWLIPFQQFFFFFYCPSPRSKLACVYILEVVCQDRICTGQMICVHKLASVRSLIIFPLHSPCHDDDQILPVATFKLGPSSVFQEAKGVELETICWPVSFPICPRPLPWTDSSSTPYHPTTVDPL